MRRRTVVLGAAAGAIAAVGGGYAWAVRDGSYQRASRTVRQGLGQVRSDSLENLVRHAVAAANGHNTQPWRFRGIANEVQILPDFSRRTPVVDPDDHHIYASLGCAAENLMIAARAAGRSVTFQFGKEQDGAISIGLGTSGSSADEALFKAIPKRQSTRSIYSGQTVPPEHLKQLADAAAIPGCTVLLITEKPRIEALLELIVAANDKQVRDPAFVRELEQWIRFNGNHAARKGDGLFAASSDNPVLPNWLGDTLFERVFTPVAERKECVEQIRSSAGFAVFVADKNEPEHWALAGRSCQRFSLMATALGIKTAFLNQATEVAEFRPRLASALGIDGQRPNLVMRFGYADPLPYSLRRPASEVIDASV